MILSIIFQLLLLYLHQTRSLGNRDCTCKRVYSFERKSIESLTSSPKFDELRDICDPNCIDECSREILKDLGGNATHLTHAGLEKICNHVTPQKSIFKDGISLYNRWDLSACAKGDLLLKNNICCRFCECSLGFLNFKIGDDQTSLVRIANFSENIFKKNNQTRAFLCSDLDHNRECEKDCRAEIANFLSGYTPIQLNENVDVYEPLLNRTESNKICQKLNRPISSPGVNVLARIETGPRDVSWHKDIHLGNICCNRSCECELVFKRGNRALNKTGKFISLMKKQSINIFKNFFLNLQKIIIGKILKSCQTLTGFFRGKQNL